MFHFQTGSDRLVQTFLMHKRAMLIAFAVFSFAGGLARAQTLPSLDACITSTDAPAIVSNRPQMKFFHGHYVHIGQRDVSNYFSSVLSEIRSTPIRGIVRRYTWSDLEPAQADYRFAQIQNDLAAAEAQSKKLFIFIQYKYRNLSGQPSVPAYIRNMGSDHYYNINNSPTGAMGTVPNWGKPIVLQSFLKMLKAMAVQFDSRQGLAGITFNETAPGVSFTTTQRDSYHFGLIRMDKGAACLFRETPVIQLTNHPKKYLPNMGSAYQSNAIGIGAPDVFSESPEDNMWESGYSYDYFAMLSPAVPRAALVAENNLYYKTYQDEINHRNYKTESPTSSVNRIFLIAKDKLKANFIFWHRSKGDDPYYIAIKQRVSSYESIASSSLPSGCPTTFANGCK